MTPDEERDCYYRTKELSDEQLETGANILQDAIYQNGGKPSEQAYEWVKQIFCAVADVAIRALPLTTESAPAQSSTATVQCISGGDTLTECEVPIVGQGDIAQGAAQPKHLVRRGLRPNGTYPPADDDGGAAPLEPVAEIAYAGIGDTRRLQFVAVKETLPDKTKLYAIPEGYAVVRVEPTEEMIDAAEASAKLNGGWITVSKSAIYRAMLAAGRVK